MGGGHRYPYPKWVWSPSGGWWPNPVNWKRNTLINAAGIGIICFFAASYCSPRTVAYYPKKPEVEFKVPKGSHH